MALTSFSVVARFEVEDLATRTLGEIADQMRATGAASEGARGRVGSFASSLRSTSTAAQGLSRAMEATAPAMEAAGASAAAAAAGFDTMTASMRGAMAAHAEMAAQLARPIIVPSPVYGDRSAAPMSGTSSGFTIGNRPTIEGAVTDVEAGSALALAAGGDGGYGGRGGGYGSGALGAADDGGGGLVPRQALVPGGASPYARPNMPFRGGGPGGGSGAGGGPPIVPVPRGNGGFGEFGLGSLGLDAVAYAGIRQAADEDLAIRQTLMNLDLPTDPDSAGYRSLAGMYDRSAEGTIFSAARTARIGRSAAGVLGRSGARGLAQYEALFPVASRLGELSEMRGRGNAEHEAVAGIEIAHMLGNYDPATIEPDLDLVNTIASRTDSSVQRQQMIYRYGLPQALALGVSARQAISDIGFNEQRMGSTTTAGSGYAAMLVALLHAEGGGRDRQSPAQRHRADTAEQALRQALSLDTDHPGDRADFDRQRAHLGGTEQVQALRSIGLVDDRGRLTVEDARGNIDMTAVQQRIAAFARGHTEAETGATLERAFLRQGERVAAIYADPNYARNRAAFDQSVAGAPSVRVQQSELAESTEQRAEQARARTLDLLNALLTASLPLLNTTLSATTHAVTGITHFFHDHPHVAEAAAVGTVGLAGVTGLSLAAGLARGPLRAAGAIARGVGGVAARAGGTILSGGVGEAVTGAAATTAEAVGAGAAAAGAGVVGAGAVVGGGLAALGTAYVLHRLGEAVDEAVPALARLDEAVGLRGHATAARAGAAVYAGTPAPASSAEQSAGGVATGAGTASATVNIHNLSVPVSVTVSGGTIDAMKRQIIAELEHVLGDDLARAFDAGGGFSGGTLQSVHAIAGGRG